jgi:phosphate transport system substrate-binding protein
MLTPSLPVGPVRVMTALLVIAGIATAAGCGREPGADSGRGTQINGAGATFPYPIYSKWFAEYHALHPDVRINYQSLGSGAGIRQLMSQTVFFGASDQPMKDEHLEAAPGRILHFPTVLGAVVPIYNVPGITGELRFSGPLLADIVLGRITTWNDPAIARHNPGVALPDMHLTFVHRSDGSGTTFVWADYLSKVSPEFGQRVGADASLNWPVGVGGKGNEGVAGMVRQTPGALGYVELIYALQNNFAVAAVQNQAGRYITPSVDSVTAAAAAAAEDIPDDFRVSITNAPGDETYPIASFTWLLLYEQPRDRDRGRIMVEFLRWALTDGQGHARDLGYAPLPASLVTRELALLDRLPLE